MAQNFAHLANHLLFLPIYYKNFKTPNITQFDALAGQIQHM
jgi:hypothetical protein